MEKRKWFTLGVLSVILAWIMIEINKEEQQSSVNKGSININQGKKDLKPYHSKNNPKIYHVFEDCISGKRISARNRVTGMGNGTLCQWCRDQKETQKH